MHTYSPKIAAAARIAAPYASAVMAERVLIQCLEESGLDAYCVIKDAKMALRDAKEALEAESNRYGPSSNMSRSQLH